MKLKIVLSVAGGLVACLFSSGHLAHAATPADPHGLTVGAKAPPFTLKDKDGREHSLEEYLKPGKFVALAFYRSADW